MARMELPMSVRRSRRSSLSRAVGVVAVVAAVAAALGTRASTSFLEVAAQPERQAPAAGFGTIDRRSVLTAIGGGFFGLGIFHTDPQPASAAMEKMRVAYPPIDRKDKYRCEFKSSAMGQANAARDKLLDLRECNMAGGNAADKDIAGALMNKGDFSGATFENTIMSKMIAEETNFENTNFKNAVIDRASFKNANLKGAIFKNAVLTGSSFEGADLTNSDFTDAYIESFGIRPLCRNPTMKGTNPVTGEDTYESAGCSNQGLAR